jgi:aspartyl-tRNA(Asn)/glutamyl-tRNA(Gln) amidotransferase subunit C
METQAGAPAQIHLLNPVDIWPHSAQKPRGTLGSFTAFAPARGRANKLGMSSVTVPVFGNERVPCARMTTSNGEKKSMSKITKEDVEYVAALAQLSPDETTKERLVKEMGEILAYMDKLNELDTSDIEPTMHALAMTNVFREDAVRASLGREEALMNAPKSDGEYFLVPRILTVE